jgi:hypothetical protein
MRGVDNTEPFPFVSGPCFMYFDKTKALFSTLNE